MALLVLGCTAKTNPATNVTATSATLNGQITLKPGEGGVIWGEYSRNNGANWTETSHSSWGDQNCTYDPSGSGGNPSPISKDVTGLTPDSYYIFRIAGTICGGSPVYFDSTGTSGGTNYSFFVTQPTQTVLKADPMTNPDPLPLWRQLVAADPSRHQWVASGGPSGGPYRRLTVFNGDDLDRNSRFFPWGERAELGQNNRNNTFYVYHEGDQRTTQFYMRLPDSFPAGSSHWQDVMQMKQVQPYSDPTTPVGVAAELQVRDNRIYLRTFWNDLWSTPVSKNQWLFIKIVATYSAASAGRSAGRIQVIVDGVASPVFAGQNLPTKKSTGNTLPAHLRLGIYHDPSIDCPLGAGCSVEYADVKILGP